VSLSLWLQQVATFIQMIKIKTSLCHSNFIFFWT